VKQCSDPEAGDPIQYDELVIEHDEGEVEIVVYNRAILLFTTGSEGVGRVHQGAAWTTTAPWSHGIRCQRAATRSGSRRSPDCMRSSDG